MLFTETVDSLGAHIIDSVFAPDQSQSSILMESSASACIGMMSDELLLYERVEICVSERRGDRMKETMSMRSTQCTALQLKQQQWFSVRCTALRVNDGVCVV